MNKLVMTALASMVAATPVLADQTNGFGVATAARARNAYSSDSFVSAYRTTGDSSGNYTRPADQPSISQTGCLDTIDSPVICSGSVSGTGGSNYNLTASNSSASRTDDAGGPPYPVSTGSAAARSSLATAEIGVEALSPIWRDYRLAPTYNGADAFAQYNDTLNFTVLGAGAGTQTNIQVTLLVEGGLGISDLRGGAGVISNFYFGTAAASYSGYIGSGSATIAENSDFRGWVNGAWDLSSPGFARFTGTYALNGGSDSLGIYNSLFAYAGGSGTASYFNTAKLFLALPTGVSFGSASGTFLSAQANAVPEPASWAMMMAGFGLVGGMMRRRATAVAAVAA